MPGSPETHTDQLEEFEEVHVGVELLLDHLQPLRREDAHGIADAVECTAAGEDQESFQQVQAASNVFQTQVRSSKGKLVKSKKKKQSWLLVCV